MELQFAGCGSQFAGEALFQSNAVLRAPGGQQMLIDCGSDAKFSLGAMGVAPEELSAVYVSHLHADHVGGLEWLALSVLFHPAAPRLSLFGEAALLEQLWEESLRGGMELIEGRQMALGDYFELCPVGPERGFVWAGLGFQLVAMEHVTVGARSMPCFGVYFGPPEVARGVGEAPAAGGVLFTSDTKFTPGRLMPHYRAAQTIFHDCETTRNHTPVHAHYDELCTLPAEIRRKIWLYHYQPERPEHPRRDGFAGFVRRGQRFALPF